MSGSGHTVCSDRSFMETVAVESAQRQADGARRRLDRPSTCGPIDNLRLAVVGVVKDFAKPSPMSSPHSATVSLLFSHCQSDSDAKATRHNTLTAVKRTTLAL